MHLSRRPGRHRLTQPGSEGGLETASLRHQWRLEAPPGGLEEVLQTRIRPLIVDLSARQDVRSVYFARYQHEALLFVDTDADLDLPGRRVPFLPELARYGGAEGFRIAEGIFQADSLPCLDILATAPGGTHPRALRETSLLLTERLLDLLAFDRDRRIAFYRAAYAWALDQGRWDEDDLRLLEARYMILRDGLAALLRSSSPDEFAGWSEATRPWIESLKAAHAGTIAQDLGSLAWSYAHMQCNRLGIDGDAEAILRYFLQRAHEDGLGTTP